MRPNCRHDTVPTLQVRQTSESLRFSARANDVSRPSPKGNDESGLSQLQKDLAAAEKARGNAERELTQLRQELQRSEDRCEQGHREQDKSQQEIEMLRKCLERMDRDLRKAQGEVSKAQEPVTSSKEASTGDEISLMIPQRHEVEAHEEQLSPQLRLVQEQLERVALERSLGHSELR